jgi:hypothetical protein
VASCLARKRARSGMGVGYGVEGKEERPQA